uniref:Uncharacterized protein n=1 Tax=viral metagenome TaxID=1070528 RepID=A0A6M3JQZ8_9ZZZZ
MIINQIEGEVHQALRTIVKNKETKALNYCVNYALAGLHMVGHELKDQCLYVLCNMEHWRGEEAKKVRKVLKHFSQMEK